MLSARQALELGIVNELVPAGEVLDRAIAVAQMTPAECLQTYAFTKRACQAGTLRDIADSPTHSTRSFRKADPMSSPASRSAATGSS